MLDDLRNMIDGLERLDTEAEVIQIIEANKDYIIHLEQQQLAAGINKQGVPRRDTYRPFTIKKKRAEGEGLGAVTDHVTFYMTGALYGSLEPEITGDEFQIRSRGEEYKYDKMIERYPEEDFGLDEESQRKFIEEKTIPEFGRVLEILTGIKI